MNHQNPNKNSQTNNRPQQQRAQGASARRPDVDSRSAFDERYEEMVDEPLRRKMTRDEQMYSLKELKSDEINRGKYADLSTFESKGHRKLSPEQMRALKRKAFLKKALPIGAAVLLLSVLLLVYILAIRPAGEYKRAKARFEAENYNAALAIFDGLGDYKESERYVTYINGVFALQREDFEEAARLFESLSGFLNSEDMQAQAQGQTSSAVLEKDYQKASAYLEKGDYEQAERAFLALGDYKDSRQKAEQAKTAALDAVYDEAVRAQEANNLDKAKELFLSLGDYKDAKDRLSQLETSQKQQELMQRYQKAYNDFNFGNYSDAYVAFQALGDYNDSAKYAAYCYAMSLKIKGEYESAAAAFEDSGDFLDSAEQVLACRYKQATVLYGKGEYESAITLFSALGNYQDSEEKLKSAQEEYNNERYRAALYAYHEGKYEEALALFEAVGDYKDALMWVEDIKKLP